MTREELLKELPKLYNKSGRINGNIHNPKSKSYQPELIKEINTYTENFKNASFAEKIYIIKNDIKERPKCYCGNELKWKSNKEGYLQYCSSLCQRKSPERIKQIKELWENKTAEEKTYLTNKVKKTKLERYGNENYNNPKKISETDLSKDQEYWDKRNEKQFKTKLERYGDEHYCNGDKISETWQNKTDEEIQERTNKQRQTYLERYGVEHPMQLKEHREKIKQTLIKNYGVEHPMYSQDIKDKLMHTKLENGTLPSSEIIKEKVSKIWENKTDEELQKINHKQLVSGVKTKIYIMPSGKEVKCQGYEPFALDVLIKRFDEDDIDVHPDFVIPYIHNGKNRRYLPDIYIKSINTIIEVKSTWTYEKDLEVNKLKEKACISQGYNFKFIIFNSKKEIQRN